MSKPQGRDQPGNVGLSAESRLVRRLSRKCVMGLRRALNALGGQTRRRVSRRVLQTRELERGLGDSRGTLSQILQGTSIPIFVIDRQHVITHWNQACENLTGLAADAVIGTRKAWIAFYAEERPVMADFIVDRRPQEEIVALYGSTCRESPTLPGGYEFEAFFPGLGGGPKWLFCTAAPLRENSGNVLGAVETFQDLTERKHVEQELERRVEELSEAKRRLEVLVLNMTDREKRMVSLKGEVNELLQMLGQAPKYQVPDRVAELRRAVSVSAAQ